MAVRHVSDYQRHPSTAVFEAGIGMKDMESWGKWFGFPRSVFHSQQSNHHVRSISEEGLHLPLYDLSLEWPEVDTLPYRNQLVDAPLRGSPTGTFNRSLCPLRGGDGCAQLAGKQLHHPCSGPQHGEAVYLTLSDDVDHSANSAGPHNQRDPPSEIRLIRHHQEHCIFIISCDTPTCMHKMTNPSGLVHFPPNPTRFNR